MVAGMILPGVLAAAEIITEEDIVQKVVVEEQLVKTADNFIILFDSSNSMNTPYERGATKTKYEVAKEMLKQKTGLIPDLGYNAGLYTYTPWKELYPMGPFDKGKFISAMDGLPAEPKGPTALTEGLRELDSVLSGLSGKTVVFLFNDGTYTQVEGMKVPPTYTEELANKYNVCFYMIDYARRGIDKKLLTDMAKANECSRVVPFKPFMETPGYLAGALWVVKSTERIDTITESRIKGLQVGHVLFDFNQADVKSQFDSELKQLGDFLKQNSNAYTLLVGYTDNVGSEEYNLGLSKRRSESVANYLMKNFGIGDDQIVVNWYGKANPVASNDTAEGRAQNRRVEIAVGGM
jgi:OOP family OmpA-OmpF porin